MFKTSKTFPHASRYDENPMHYIKDYMSLRLWKCYLRNLINGSHLKRKSL